MSTRTLIAALYAVGGLAVLAISFLSYHMYHDSQDPDSATTAVSGTRFGSFGSGSSSTDTVRLMHGPGHLARLQQRMNELEHSLQQTSAMLEKRTAELQKKHAECTGLQADLDESLTVVFDLLAADNQSRKTPIGETEVGSAAGDESQTELVQLKAELQQVEFLATEQTQQIEDLRADLIRAEADIADIQMAAGQEIDALLDTQQSLESVSARSLIHAGKPVVPALIHLLADERVDMRAFSAYVLGEIGADADEATTTLLSLLSDPDEGVREQSRQALSKIAPMSIP